MSRTHPRALRLTAVLGLLPITAVLGWAWVGDQSSEGFGAGELDYAYRAPEFVLWQWVAIVALAGLVGLAAITIGLHQRVSRTALVLAPLVGLALAATGRAATAGTIGANIGFALTVIFLLPIVAAVLVLALVLAWRQPRTTSAP